MRTENKLEILITKIKNKHIYIQMHNFPDPDAIASAFALSYLLSVYDIKATIFAYGKIDRFNTEKMIELFNIPVKFIEDMELNIEKDDEIILVDSQYGNGNIEKTNGKIIASIDHHKRLNEYTYEYIDIRDNMGACASILASYFHHNNMEIPSNVAEALLYGIKVDTLSLTRGVSQFDMDMFYYLYNKCNKLIMNFIEKNTLRFNDLTAYENAIKTIRLKGKISFSDAGYGCNDALVAVISDFMLDLSEVSLSVTFSVKNDGVKLSVRSEDDYHHAGDIIIEALRGIGTGGGHGVMAGGFIPFSEKINLLIKENRLFEYIENLFFKVIEKKSFQSESNRQLDITSDLFYR